MIARVQVKVSVEHEDGRTVVAVEGELDAFTAGEMRPVIDKLVEEKRSPIVLSLSGLRLIDSSGVASLVGLLKRIRAQGGAVTVEGLKDQPLAIFRLLRLDRVFGP